MDQSSHSYGLAGTNEVGAFDRNRPGGSGEPPLPAFRRALALRRGGFMLAKQRDPESIRGFTLVELLIATGITVAMVLMLGLMLGSLMSSASHATERVDAFRDARAALQTIERDLRNLVPTQWDVRTSPIPTPTPVPITRAAAYFALKNIYTGDPATGNQQLYALVAARSTG